MAGPEKLLLAILAGKSRKEVADMLTDEQRDMLLKNVKQLPIGRAERRRIERGLGRKR
ncbi:MAG: hypothetical protein IJA95_06635 [Bacteroidaceae bacterium]|nr:hypothetical protein [Bacteroidaceae bacterium]